VPLLHATGLPESRVLSKKRGLGRGLDALLSGAGLAAAHDSPATDSSSALRQVPVDLIERGRYQPRTNFDEESLKSLADSIRSQGVVQPIVVRPLSKGRYELVAGERRWRAAQTVGLSEIPAIVRNMADDAALAIALIENIQREELNPLEEARALRRLVDEFDMTHQAAADAVGRSRASISNALRLLDLSPAVAELLDCGTLEMGHARALLALEPHAQRTAAEHIVAKRLTVRQAEALVRTLLAPPKAPVRGASSDPDIARLEQRLAQHLGARVKLDHRANGRGRVTISYHSLDELDGVLSRIGAPGEEG
jgi:ParB family transcriptional regulator, chromosome partitioning protein